MSQPLARLRQSIQNTPNTAYEIKHHGAVSGVTGSCHELCYSLNHQHTGVLIDCGLFQGAETQEHSEKLNSTNQDSLLDDTIPFDISHIKALIITHVHIDHVGRIPYLLVKGFNGPIYCSEASAKLLPLVLEDAIKIGFTRNHRYVQKFVKHVQTLIQPLVYNKWQTLDEKLKIKLKPAGHILGSAYVICKLTPAKTAVKPVAREKYLTPVGASLLAKKSQTELYEAAHAAEPPNRSAKVNWQNLEVILDSPLAAKFTHAIGQLKHCWDAGAQRKVKMGRRPLTFDNLTTINTHKEHVQTVEYLANNKRPAIVIAASGMCNGGRVMNYLKAMLGDARHDVLFVGYQASGTIGRLIQKYGPSGGYVTIYGEKITIKAKIHTMGGYSAHAGQTDLLNFVKRMWRKPSEIRLIHGDNRAKQNLQAKLQAKYVKANVWIPKG